MGFWKRLFGGRSENTNVPDDEKQPELQEKLTNLIIDQPTIWKAHEDEVTSITFLPAGQGLISGSSDEKLNWWASNTFLRKRQIAFNYGIANVAANPDGSAWGAAIYDGTAAVWFLPDGRRKDLPKQMTAHYSVAFSPDGKWYAMGFHYGAIFLFPTTNYTQTSLKMEQDYGAPIGLAFSSSGDYLAASYSENRIVIWDVQKREIARELPIDRAGSVAFLDSCGQIVIGTVWRGDERKRKYPDSVLVLDDNTGELVCELENSRKGIAVSSDNKILACCSLDGGLQLWDTTKWKKLASLEVPGETALCTSISFENDQVACGTQEGSIAVFDISYQ